MHLSLIFIVGGAFACNSQNKMAGESHNGFLVRKRRYFNAASRVKSCVENLIEI
jgi:hypothetical protein